MAKARGEGRRAAADLRLARAEIRGTRASLAIAERKHALGRRRIGILERPPHVALEREIVAHAQREAGRTRAELARLAGRRRAGPG